MSNTTATATATATHGVTAKSRGGVTNWLTKHSGFAAGQGFAVDVQLDGAVHYNKGAIVRFFASKADATAFAAGINSGNLAVVGNASKQAWYAKRHARKAIVVPAYNVPVGKSAADVLAAKANASKRASRKGKGSAPAATTATPATASAAATIAKLAGDTPAAS